MHLDIPREYELVTLARQYGLHSLGLDILAERSPSRTNELPWWIEDQPPVVTSSLVASAAPGRIDARLNVANRASRIVGEISSVQQLVRG